jgi:hypothetical protein
MRQSLGAGSVILDVDSVLRVIGTVSERYQTDSPEDEALRVAAGALLYIRDIQKLEEYREYFRKSFAPAKDTVIVSQTFGTREQADEWLASGGASDGELVRIAGQGFRVFSGRQGMKFLRTPLPEELEPS